MNFELNQAPITHPVMAKLAVTSSFHCGQRDYPSKIEYRCHHYERTKVPDVPAESQWVLLGYNNISSLRENEFSHLHQCKWLAINSNQISEIEPGKFRGLSAPKYLELSSNRLTIVQKDMFLACSF